MQRIFHKRLKLNAYKVQLMQHLEPNDKHKLVEFANTMLDRLGADSDFMSTIFFLEEVNIHVSGKVNQRNVRIGGSQNPRATQEYVRDNPKLNTLCSFHRIKSLDHFSSSMTLSLVPYILTCFFAEETVCGTTYFDMLEQFIFPQMEQLQPKIRFQQDGAPPHWFSSVKFVWLRTAFSLAVGLVGEDRSRGPPRSPDLTPLDFFLWGHVKDKVYVIPVRDLRDLREHIIEAFESISEDMRQGTWQEIVHRLDIVTMTAGGHIEMWWCVFQNLSFPFI